MTDRVDLSEWIHNPYARLPSNEHVLQISDALVRSNQSRIAASVLDRLWSRAPLDPQVCRARQAVLDSFAKKLHKMTFRYVPEGAFVMGSEEGDDDERPTRIMQVPEFWIADVPVSFAVKKHIEAIDIQNDGLPAVADPFYDTVTARLLGYYSGAPGLRSSRAVSNTDPALNELPAVALRYTQCESLCARLSSTNSGKFAVPSEVQWEKAARGGLHQEPFPWGSSEPSSLLCDFDRFKDFSIRSPRDFQPNGYGLYGIAGTVFEWCSTFYDALEYSDVAVPTVPESAKRKRVIRGGSWADCAYVCRVSFRSSHAPTEGYNPNIGFRPVLII